MVVIFGAQITACKVIQSQFLVAAVTPGKPELLECSARIARQAGRLGRSKLLRPAQLRCCRLR
jgi:hypothetical protein